MLSLQKEIFVFGSNLAGIHGAGSALAAYEEYGAIMGLGVGLANNSYAIPTKDKQLVSLTSAEIEPYVHDFLNFAQDNPDLTFNIVDIGCGLAGFTVEQIAPMFADAPANCVFLGKFKEFLNR